MSKNMNKLIVIVGPTSSHKTSLALKLHKLTGFPLINADAFQVYKELNIGTNKMDKKSIKETPVYLMDNISIYEDWNIKKFKDNALQVMDQIYKNKQVPILVGGSNLYVDALIKNYDLSSTNARTTKYDNLSNEEIHNLLDKLDHDEASKIPVNNRKRAIRALQIIDETGNTKTSKDKQKEQYFYDCLVLYMSVDRKNLYDTINKRVHEMILEGWDKEVDELLRKDPNVIKTNAFKALGYKEVADAIINKEKINEELIAQKTRRYAKRQITWCKHQYPQLFAYSGSCDDIKLQNLIKDFLVNK